jgi:glyoxylase-like metal-dependent hydrolase (beta-lactamase superfamily II)
MLRFGVCLFLTGLLAGTAQAASDSPASNFEVQTIAEGVYAVVRQDPPGLMVDANSVFIVNEDDVVVVDTSGAPSTAREVVAALRKITSKPVRYVINTHWHDDHIIGDTVYREIFPGVEFIGHAEAREDDSYVRTLARMFASVQQQTAAAVARGETLEQARKSVDLEEFRKILAGDSQLRSVIFRTYVTSPAVTAAFRETSAKGPV